MMAWLFAVFQYKNEAILNEARDLKKRREMDLWQWVAILWNFLPKGCCVHKNTMWIQSKIRQVLRRGICWGLPNRQTTPGFEIPQAEKSWKVEQYYEESILYFWFSAYSSLGIRLQTLFLGFVCLKVHQSTGDETWQTFSHIFLNSEEFRKIQGREDTSLQVLSMPHCSRDTLGVPRIFDLCFITGV